LAKANKTTAREVKMNKRSKVLAGASILVVLLVAFMASVAYAHGPNPWAGSGFGRGGHGHEGMTGGWGYGIGPTTGITGTVPYGPAGCPGMDGWGWGYPGADTPLTLDQAVERVQQYLTAYGNPDLVLTEVMEFSRNFYAEVEEESTGIHAFELLINRYTGAVYPEPGPNMMWNTKYGHMGGWGGMMGMWGGWGRTPTAEMPVTAAQAFRYAQRWLDVYLPGTTVADEADTFYGYYTIHVLRDGQIYGMLSVNGYTGQVWYHTWHGDFIAMWEAEREGVSGGAQPLRALPAISKSTRR